MPIQASGRPNSLHIQRLPCARLRISLLLATSCCIGEAGSWSSESPACQGHCEEAVEATTVLLQTSLQTRFDRPEPSGTSKLGWHGTTGAPLQRQRSRPPPGPQPPTLTAAAAAESGPLPWQRQVLLESESRRHQPWQLRGWMGTIARCLVVLGFVCVAAAAVYVVFIAWLKPSEFTAQRTEGKVCVDTWSVLFLICLYSVWEFVVTDQYLPNMPEMQVDLGASHVQISFTVVEISILKGVLGFPIGLISDRIGRRRIVLFLFALLPVSVLACGLAPDIRWFVAARVLTGISEAVSSVTGGILRDMFDNPEERMKAKSLWITINMVCPVLAPSVGGALGVWIGWRSVFMLLVPGMAFCWLQLYRNLPETLSVEPNTDESFWENVLQMVNLRSVVLLVTGCSMLLVYWVMIANISLILEGDLGFTAMQTSIALGAFALVAVPGSHICSMFSRRLGALGALRTGIVVLLVPVALYLVSAGFPHSRWAFLGAHVSYWLVGLVLYIAAEVFFTQPFKRAAGLAQALWAFFTYGVTNLLVMAISFELEKSANKPRDYDFWVAGSMILAMTSSGLGFALCPPKYALEAQREFEEGMANNGAEPAGGATEQAEEPGKDEMKPAAAAILSAA